MKTFRLKVLVSVVLSALVSLGVATAALAATTGGVGGRPAHPDPKNPRSESIFIHTLERGKSAEDEVLVANNSDSERAIELYAVDGVVTNTGAYTCRQKSEPLTASGGWVKLSKTAIHLKPGAELRVPFKVSVPDNADVGEHNACLVFADKEDDGEVQGSFRVRTRQAVRMVVTIPGDLHRKISLASFNVDNHARRLDYSLRLQNEGNVSADVDVHVILTSLFGKEIYNDGGVYPVLSNEKLELNFSNEDLPFWGGWYKTSSSSDYNSDPKTLGFNAEAPLVGLVSQEETVFISPSREAIYIIVGSLIIIITSTALRVGSKRKTKRQQQNWYTYQVKTGDSLESLAGASGSDVNWKRVAKINRIKPPFTLREGQEVKLPALPKGSDEDILKPASKDKTSQEVDDKKIKISAEKKRPLGKNE